MSSPENERRDSRGSSGRKQKNASSPRHFRDEKTGRKKASEPVKEPVIEEPELELSAEDAYAAERHEDAAAEYSSGNEEHRHHSDSHHHSDGHHSDSHHSYHSGSGSSDSHHHHHHHHSSGMSESMVTIWDVENERGHRHRSSSHSSSHDSSAQDTSAQVASAQDTSTHDTSTHDSSSHSSSLPEASSQSAAPESSSSSSSSPDSTSPNSSSVNSTSPNRSSPQGDPKRVRASHRSPDFVKPVEQEDRVKPKKMQMQATPETTFDYVAPTQTFNQHRKHPERSTLHSGKTKTASREEVEEAEEGFVFRSLSASDKKRRRHRRHHHHSSSSGSSGRSSSSGSSGSGTSSGSSSGSSGSKKHHHHHRHLPKWAKITLIVVAALLGLALIAGIVVFVMYQIGDSVYRHKEMTIVSPTTAATNDEPAEQMIDVIDNGRTIVYEGKTYRFNEKIAIIGFIGVNYNYEEKTMHAMGDAVDLIAYDPTTAKLSIIGISRDAMADINVFSDEGNPIDIEKMQLAYAYYFGDVSKTTSGGANTAAALSRLFYGLPVDDFFAMNLDALISLNDAIGGVTMTFTEDFESPIRTISAGETVTLFGTEVEYFVRYRDTEDVEGNNDRMGRQQQYIRAFLEQVIPAVRKDPISTVTNLYNIVKANSSSSLNLTEIIRLATDLVTNLKSTGDIEYLTLGGKAVKGAEHTEFIVDDQSALETLIKVFYQPVES